MRRLFPSYLWLMPTGENGPALLRVLDIAKQQQRPYVEMAIHSSELMPGGSPKLQTPDQIERLYADLETLFSTAAQTFTGQTLAEHYERFASRTLERGVPTSQNAQVTPAHPQ